MKSKRRTPIPQRLEHEILFRNQNVCCVCQKSGVQIHHIDGNPSNNELQNLCVLCVEHHALASSKSSMTKGFYLIGPHEVAMRPADESNLLLAIELLGDLGFHTAVVKYDLPKEILKTFELFYQIGVWYNKEAVKQEIRKQLTHIKDQYESEQAAVEGIDLLMSKLDSIR